MAGEFKAWEREISRFERALDAAMVRATRDAAQLLLEEMQALTGAIGASLEELARAGHPYAKRHPKGSGPFADWITHVQEGELRSGLSRGSAVVTLSSIEVRILSDARHTWYLIQDAHATQAGKMRPRDFVSAAIIYQIDQVSEIYRRAFASVHSVQTIQSGFMPITSVIRHGGVAADLPEGGVISG